MSNPGDPGWKWFPNNESGWRLDVVTLLAVIGESSMAEHSQVITASLLCMLPRLLPAPQALLKPSRPTRLPETTAKMVGVYSGTMLDSVGFFANIITPLDALPAYSFKVLEIEHAPHVPPPAAVAGAHHHLHIHHHNQKQQQQQQHRGKASGLWAGTVGSLFNTSSKRNSSGEKSPELPRTSQDVESGQDQQQQQQQSKPPQPDDLQSRTATVHFDDDTNIGPLRRRITAKENFQDLLSTGTLPVTGARPIVPAQLFSPIHVLSVFSCALSIAIFIAAIFWTDGAAMLAIFLISAASTIVGYASLWKPILMQRRHTNEVPRGDVMIRTREGAFVLVRCSEDVARELYSGTEECEYYVGGRTYRMLMAVGTMLLMVSVVLLGNCTWNSQVFIGGSYIVLNGLYWSLGMIPRTYFWDLSRYVWRDATPDDAKFAEDTTDPDDKREGYPSFTRTLWYAIRETSATAWASRSGAAAGTDQWKQWLEEARRNAKDGNRQWEAVRRKNEIMSEASRNGYDPAAQHAPLTEVHANPNPNPAWNRDAAF